MYSELTSCAPRSQNLNFVTRPNYYSLNIDFLKYRENGENQKRYFAHNITILFCISYSAAPVYRMIYFSRAGYNRIILYYYNSIDFDDFDDINQRHVCRWLNVQTPAVVSRI